jgi:hypothetical protein
MPTQNEQNGAKTGAAKGAAAGSVVPGLGTSVGYVAGGASGYFQGRRKDRQQRGQEDQDRSQAANYALAVQMAQQIEQAQTVSPELAQLIQQQQSQLGGPLDPAQITQLHSQWNTQSAQNAMLRQINDYYTNPALAQQTQAYLNQQQQDSLGALKDQTRLATRESAFNASRAGVRGSSMEAEQGVALRNAQQQGVADTVAARAGTQAQIEGARRNSRAQMMQLALQQPGQAQFNNTMAGIRQQGAMEGEQAGVQQQFNQVRRQSAQNYADILAGGIRGVAGSVRASNSYDGA